MIALDDRWWRALFFERETEKEDPTFFAVHDTDGVVDAYAAYRVKHGWTDSLPDLELTVKQLIATTPDAYADIWRFVFDVDLVRRVKAWNRPVDEPLIYLMEEPNQLRFRTSNALWVRLVDVPAALEARGYAATADRRRRRGPVLSLERGPVRTRRQWGSGLVPTNGRGG
jgi:predicted acetyltransferase